MTRLALSNPIAILMICIGLVVFAFVVTPRMPIDTFPDITPPVLVVGTQVPGLVASEMEKTISWRIEKYAGAVPGVDHVQSTSQNGLSIVYVWLQWGTDLAAAQVMVQQQVAFAMAAVPRSLGAYPPFVLQYDPTNAPVIQVVVAGGNLTGAQLFDYAQNYVEPMLESIPGVASAAPNGGRQRQINVVVDMLRAQARGLTAEDVAQAVSRANALLPSGQLIAPLLNANVYTNAVAARVDALEEAVVTNQGGRPVLIRDVARVEDGGAANTQAVSVDGHDAIYLNVLRIPGGNTLRIVESVKRQLAELRNLPPGMTVRTVFDQSTFVRSSYNGLKREVLHALLLVAIVILLFLQNMRGTIIVSVAIPLSFAITLIVLSATGQTLNAFTLGGLTLAMGRLVDDAVVVLESIHRHQRMGESTHDAALHGASAVALPVLASTLTTVVVLLPILLLTGLARRLFAPLAITVAVAMFASYFVSMAVTPVAAAFFIGKAQHGRLGSRVEKFIDRIAEGYASGVRVALRHRGVVVLTATVLFAASVLWARGLPSMFFPEIDESMERAYVRFAPGTSLEEASRQINAMGATLRRELPPGMAQLVLTNVGTPGNARSAITSPNWGPHMGFIRIALPPPERRHLTQGQLADLMRGILNRDYPGVDVLQWPGGLVASVFSNGYLAPIVVEIRGDDLHELVEASTTVSRIARSIGGVRDVYPLLQTTYPELHFDTGRQLAGVLGIDARVTAQATLDATIGNINTPSVWIDANNGQSYYVITFYDPAQISDADALARIPVLGGERGQGVILNAVADVRRSTGPVAIERNAMQRAAHVLMQTERRDIGSAANELEAALRSNPRTRNLHFSYVGQVDLMRTTFAGLGPAIGIAIMLVFMIMASQFKSLRLPFVMLFTIPVTLIGIVAALLLGGQGISIPALMGVLMVIGIAVSNGILLVNEAKVHVLEGKQKIDAVVEAARSRFVPIMMTSLATIIGLLPGALGLEAGGESNRPLALAVVGGLTSSTLLSLFLVPVIFSLIGRGPAPKVPESQAPA